MITEIITMLLLGIMNDVLITLYYIFVGKLLAVPASLITVLITLLNFFIIKEIVISTDWVLILFYALGCAIGCFSIILHQKTRLKNKTKKKLKNKPKK